MPGFDGTGPRGLGPMTGHGEGYCALVLPAPETGGMSYGYAGLQGMPVRLGTPVVPSALSRHLACWLYPATRLGSAFRRWTRRGVGRGRRRW